jgi:hypothetical protein
MLKKWFNFDKLFFARGAIAPISPALFLFVLGLLCANRYQTCPAIYTKLKIIKKQTFGITMRPAELTSLFLNCFSKRNLSIDGSISWNIGVSCLTHTNPATKEYFEGKKNNQTETKTINYSN